MFYIMESHYVCDRSTAAPEELVELLNCRNSREKSGNSTKEHHASKTITHQDSLILMSGKSDAFNM